jgi:hypothetical protein
MHDATFPESAESPEQRSARAVTALEYEERAGLGFRRRERNAVGDPWAHPQAVQVDREESIGELFGAYLSGLGAVLGGLALVVCPLIFGSVGLVLAMGGVIGGGRGVRIGKVALVVSCFGFFLGMLFAISTDRPVTGFGFH